MLYSLLKARSYVVFLHIVEDELKIPYYFLVKLNIDM